MKDINQLIKDINKYLGTDLAIMLRHSKGVIMITGIKQPHFHFSVDRALTDEENKLVNNVLASQERQLLQRSQMKRVVITEKMRRTIQACKQAGIPAFAIAQKFSVCEATISRICRTKI